MLNHLLVNDLEHAFLQDIIENPDDDTPRLVMADWLGENGQEERSEFIRVQCELAKAPICPATIYHPEFDAPDYGGKLYVVPPPQKEKKPCGWCPVCKLRRREEELFSDRNALTWCQSMGVGYLEAMAGERSTGLIYGDFPAAGKDCEVVFRRGFIHFVKCSLATWLEHGPVIVQRHPVQVVTATDREPLHINWSLTQPDLATAFGLMTCASELSYGHPWWIPGEVFDLLEGFAAEQVMGDYTWKVWYTEADALAVLSRALIQHARSKE